MIPCWIYFLPWSKKALLDYCHGIICFWWVVLSFFLFKIRYFLTSMSPAITGCWRMAAAAEALFTITAQLSYCVCECLKQTSITFSFELFSPTPTLLSACTWLLFTEEIEADKSHYKTNKEIFLPWFLQDLWSFKNRQIHCCFLLNTQSFTGEIGSTYNFPLL